MNVQSLDNKMVSFVGQNSQFWITKLPILSVKILVSIIRNKILGVCSSFLVVKNWKITAYRCSISYAKLWNALATNNITPHSYVASRNIENKAKVGLSSRLLRLADSI